MAKILVCIAWPYASGPRHLGHAAATFIPADVFARYHRMKGDEVLVVGGTDMHGTPTTVRADEEGVPPSVVADRFHVLHAKNIEQLGVASDLYWDNRFLPDRYVEGTCPNCGYDRARGDQCESCGHLWDPFELKDPRCRIHGTRPVPKETNHLFFRLSAFEEPIKIGRASCRERV